MSQASFEILSCWNCIFFPNKFFHIGIVFFKKIGIRNLQLFQLQLIGFNVCCIETISDSNNLFSRLETSDRISKYLFIVLASSEFLLSDFERNPFGNFNIFSSRKFCSPTIYSDSLEIEHFKVVSPGIEPGTHGFSVRCSTN